MFSAANENVVGIVLVLFETILTRVYASQKKRLPIFGSRETARRIDTLLVTMMYVTTAQSLLCLFMKLTCFVESVDDTWCSTLNCIFDVTQSMLNILIFSTIFHYHFTWDDSLLDLDHLYVHPSVPVVLWLISGVPVVFTLLINISVVYGFQNGTTYAEFLQLRMYKVWFAMAHALISFGFMSYLMLLVYYFFLNEKEKCRQQNLPRLRFDDDLTRVLFSGIKVVITLNMKLFRTHIIWFLKLMLSFLISFIIRHFCVSSIDAAEVTFSHFYIKHVFNVVNCVILYVFRDIVPNKSFLI